MHKFLYVLFLGLSAIVLLEVGLRISGVYLTHHEKGSGLMVNEFGLVIENDHLHIGTPGMTICDELPEFNFCCNTNALGFKGEEWEQKEDESPVFFVGDSFVEGVGADCRNNLPNYFKNYALADSINVSILNAGISGSDVFYAYKVIEEIVLDFHPSTVMLGINNSDVYEHQVRGGFERFRNDGTTGFKASPVPEKLYKHCHVYRYYLHGLKRLDSYTLTSKANEDNINDQSIRSICEAVTRIDSLCNTSGSQLYVFCYPIPKLVDLGIRDLQVRTIHNCIKGHDVNSLLLSEDFYAFADSASNTFIDLFWRDDAHFNADGYDLFAHILYNALDRDYPNWKNEIKRFR